MLRSLIVVMVIVGSAASLPNKPSSGYERPPFCDAECPEYEVVCSRDEYEVRRYPSGKWVSTSEQGITQTAASARAFWRLFTYIQGSNDQDAKIPMTAPVLVEVSKKQSSWVIKDYVVSFYLPKAFWEFVPKPLDPKVFIEETKEHTVFVRSFGGLASDPFPGQQAAKLQSLLDKNSEPYNTGFYYSAGYDKPSKAINRHNEVWLVLRNDEADTYTCQSVVEPEITPAVAEKLEIEVDVGLSSKSEMGQCEKAECPDYLSLTTYSHGIEKRRYFDGVYVTKEIQSCWYDIASMEGFWALFRYINGENDRKEKISMTAPVIMSIDTAPSDSTFCKVSYKMSFYIPKRLHVNPPRPTEDGVSIKRVRNLRVYVKTFGGWTTNAEVKRMRQGFTNELESLGLCYYEKHYWTAVYDAPTKLFGRRNEIWVADCENTGESIATIGVTEEQDMEEVDTEDTKLDETLPTATFEVDDEDDVPKPSPGSFSVCIDRDIECPDFEFLERQENDIVQERKYQPSNWISKTVQACDISEAQATASRSLVDYMKGMNSLEADIAMTAPILTTVDTTTMDENKCNATYTVSLYISQQYQENPPQPDDEDLFISVVDSRVYVKSFDSWPTLSKTQELVQDIENTLIDDDTCQLVNSDVYYVAGYDRPLSTSNPHSEVWVPMRFCFEDDVSNAQRKLYKLKKERLFADPNFDGLEYKHPLCTDGDAECVNYDIDSIHLHYERRTYKRGDRECYVHPRGADYRGEVSVTLSGIPCQKWSEQEPHEHGRDPESFPYGGIGDHNYCRNPDGEPVPWCYTIDPETRWNYCNVSQPGEHCGIKLACIDTEACNYQGATRQVYYPLHHYLTAKGNQQNVDIEMVLPVIRQIKYSELSKPSCDKMYKTCFYLPEEFQTNPPQPVDPRVTIEEMPPTSFYVTAFGGHVSDDVLKREISNVQAHIEDDDLYFTYSDVVFTAEFFTPMREEDRYSEIWLPIPRD
ncbi:uncharacterized protein LOC144440904 [Glandiceps talaboti]